MMAGEGRNNDRNENQQQHHKMPLGLKTLRVRVKPPAGDAPVRDYAKRRRR